MKYQSVIQAYGDSAGSKGLILKLKPGDFDKYKAKPVPDCEAFEYDAADDNAALRWLEKSFRPEDNRPLMGRAYVRSGRPKFRARLNREERETLAKTGEKPYVVPKPVAGQPTRWVDPNFQLPPIMADTGRVDMTVPSTILAEPGAEYEIRWMNVPVIFFKDRRDKKRETK
jgi:hypothetical protein